MRKRVEKGSKNLKTFIYKAVGTKPDQERWVEKSEKRVEKSEKKSGKEWEKEWKKEVKPEKEWERMRKRMEKGGKTWKLKKSWKE